ncbi:MAG: hypothetical protein ACOX27_10510 [Caldicoprobacterales bacterium]|jgi:predicted transcriptional regulator|nr:hypothetical protein [Clostridiales bacterium]
MLMQFKFLPLVLEGVKEKQHLYAADILFQLYRCQSYLSVEEIISFFRNCSPFPVWETIMTLHDFNYIESTGNESRNKFRITEKGVEKTHMMLACFRAGKTPRQNHMYDKWL